MSYTDQPPDDAQWGLACPFLNADPAYAQGVEFGMLWKDMQNARKRKIRQYILCDNEEQVRVAASRLGWEVVKLESWEHDGKETGWVYCVLRRFEAGG